MDKASGVSTLEQIFPPNAFETVYATFWPSAVAEFEHRTIRRRTENGKRSHLEAGGFVWRPIYGHGLVTQPIEGKHVRIKIPIPDPEASERVVKAFEKLLAGQSRVQIAK